MQIFCPLVHDEDIKNMGDDADTHAHTHTHTRPTLLNSVYRLHEMCSRQRIKKNYLANIFSLVQDEDIENLGDDADTRYGHYQTLASWR